MTSKEKILLILNAIVEARTISSDPSLVNLYLSRADGLDDFDPNEIFDILTKIENDEKVLIIEGIPGIVDLHTGTVADEALYNTKTYFSIRILDTFDQWLQEFIKVDKSEKLIYFDNRTGELNIHGKVIKIRRNTFRSDLIALVLQKKMKTWSWDEVVEKIQGTSDKDLLKENKSKFYSACDGLQKSIAQKTSINDFLIFNTNTVRINPCHLDSSSKK